MYKALQNFSLALIKAGIINTIHNNLHAGASTHTQRGKRKIGDKTCSEWTFRRVLSPGSVFMSKHACQNVPQQEHQLCAEKSELKNSDLLVTFYNAVYVVFGSVCCGGNI